MPILTTKGKILVAIIVFIAASLVMYNIPMDIESAIYDLMFGLLDVVRWLMLIEILVIKIKN